MNCEKKASKIRIFQKSTLAKFLNMISTVLHLKKNKTGDGYVYYLDCSDSFTGVHRCLN